MLRVSFRTGRFFPGYSQGLGHEESMFCWLGGHVLPSDSVYLQYIQCGKHVRQGQSSAESNPGGTGALLAALAPGSLSAITL